MSKNSISKALNYISKNGLKGFGKKLRTSSRKTIIGEKEYAQFLEKNSLTKGELEAQKNVAFEFSPLISIVVPTYNTSERMLKEMLASCIEQTYSNWELCIADASSDDNVFLIIKEFAKKDERIKAIKLEENLGISNNTNKALNIARGEYIALLDHDDLLSMNAFYEVVNTMQKGEFDVIYSDEDKISEDSSYYCDPNFKPDFSIDLLRSHNYITHLLIIKKNLIDELGGLRSEYDGAQDYDLLLRCVEKTNKIAHISKVLYHWRISSMSTAGNVDSKGYAFEAGKRALEDHYKRVNIEACVEHTECPGLFHTRYILKNKPFVSIIVDDRKNSPYLSSNLKRLYKDLDRNEYEILVLSNEKFLKKTISNARGEYLLFVNSYITPLSQDSVEEMIGLLTRDDVALVTGKIFDSEDYIVNAGMIVDDKVARYSFEGYDRFELGSFYRLKNNCNITAASALCFMISKECLSQVEGFDESYLDDYNIIDFCLKLKNNGYNLVYNAYSDWLYRKPKSENLLEIKTDSLAISDDAKRLLCCTDPFYNVNLSKKGKTFILD